jgi:hypothetical protein
VEYCAEQFENDGSLTTAVLKNIKRAEAGESSRELSVKVFAGQRRLALGGFHVGATPGYPEEVRIVHRAYELFIDEKQSPFDIAKQLNIEGIPAHSDAAGPASRA